MGELGVHAEKYEHDPQAGTCTLCQDIPDVFGVGACQNGVEVYTREGCIPE